MAKEKSLLDSLRKEGLGLVNMPASLAEATLVMEEKWLKFIEQPFAHKQLHAPQKGGGYEYRGPTATDHKETFHVSLGYVLPDGSSDIDIEYVTAVKQAIMMSVALVRNYIADIADLVEFADNIEQMMMERYEHWVIRSVHYFQLTADEIEAGKKIMAASHVDQFHTFHLNESAAGFMKYWDGEWIPVEPQPLGKGDGMKVVTYGGLNTQYYTECEIPALCHRVDYTEYTETHGRTSQLLFVDFGYVKHDKDTYGPTQKHFPLGENYLVDWPTFSGYFIERTLVA